MIYSLLPSGVIHGCHERKSKCGDGTFPLVYSDIEQSIPESDWGYIAGDNFPRGGNVRSRGGDGSCSSNVAATLLEGVRASAGLPFIEFSATPLYDWVKSTARPGSSIDENLLAVSKEGLLPVTTVEWMDIPDFASLVTALSSGLLVGFGVTWGHGGHAVVGTSVQRNGSRYEIEFQNSLGIHWGTRGCGRMDRSQVEAGIQRYGAWAGRVPVDTPKVKVLDEVIKESQAKNYERGTFPVVAVVKPVTEGTEDAKSLDSCIAGGYLLGCDHGGPSGDDTAG